MQYDSSNSRAARVEPRCRQATRNMAPRRTERTSSSPTFSGRLKSWAVEADAQQIQWGVRRSPAARVASWCLVGALIAGAYIARANLGSDTMTSALLTAVNAIALALAIGALRRTRLPPLLHSGILAVFLVGGLFQLYLLSYNLLRDPFFMSNQAPLLTWITPSDTAEAYGLITLAFVTFCLLVTLLAPIPVRTRFPRVPSLTNFGLFTSVLVCATIGYAALTAVQLAYGFGRASLPNPSLPFNLVAVTLFYRQNLYPALLVMGVWVYDRQRNRLSYLCVTGIGAVTVAESYASTARGAIITFGVPLVFLWMLMGRFTKFRKLLVVGGIAAYLITAPVLSAIRVARVDTAVGAVPTGSAEPSPSPLSIDSLDRELGHFVLRVGGAGSTLFAMHKEDHLSLAGIGSVYRPSGLTSYFNREVVRVPVARGVIQNQSPTVIGMGTLIGGATGIVLVVAVSVLGLDLAWRWMAKHLWSWPVALALLAHAALVFFSEGTTVKLYKSLLAIAGAELLYRSIARRPTRSVKSGQPGESLAPSRG
jgi:hypothetical protein